MFNFPFTKKQNGVKPVVLVILDGYGAAPPSSGNAISLAKTPTFDSLLENYPNTQLIAAGESVGLPANEEGNTEVGHLTIGAGRVVLQELKRINLAIENGSFFNNRALLNLANHVKSKNSKLHIFSLVGSGKVHSSMDHLYAVLQFFKKEALDRVFLHLFTDGRDAPPKEAGEIVDGLEHFLSVTKSGTIASISGRYFAMDRDRRWDRIEGVYKALVFGEGLGAKSAKEAIEQAYSRNQTDEFIEPTVVVSSHGEPALVSDGDGVIFTNFRIDRPRELTMSFVVPDFENLGGRSFDETGGGGKNESSKTASTFNRVKVPRDLFFVTMTQYHKNIPVSDVAFPPANVDKPLASIISDAGMTQLHMSESEKERFVTYYFNGLREGAFPNEDRIIVPSPKVATYDLKPEMSLPELSGLFVKHIKSAKYNFCVVNFANPDMVAHTGNLKATIRAVEFTDNYLSHVVKAILSMDGTIIVTADHGNAEELLNFPASSFFYTTKEGTINTDHSNNPVPVVVASKALLGKKISQVKRGGLADIAPTVLNVMGLGIPPDMTGRSLLEFVK